MQRTVNWCLSLLDPLMPVPALCLMMIKIYKGNAVNCMDKAICLFVNLIYVQLMSR